MRRAWLVFSDVPATRASALQVHRLRPNDRARFQKLLAQHHYLGDPKPVDDWLQQVVTRDGQWVALVVWGPAALKLKDRDRWIGWHATHQLERLKLVAQNRRYLLLHARGTEPNLASQVLAAATRDVAGDRGAGRVRVGTGGGAGRGWRFAIIGGGTPAPGRTGRGCSKRRRW